MFSEVKNDSITHVNSLESTSTCSSVFQDGTFLVLVFLLFQNVHQLRVSTIMSYLDHFNL